MLIWTVKLVIPFQMVFLLKCSSSARFWVTSYADVVALFPGNLFVKKKTAQSSCEAEIFATTEYYKELLSIRLHATDIGMIYALTLTTVYNNNQACVDVLGSFVGN